ncbi:hypothetical protein [Salinibacter ruber]|uniref:hypothetical protein n=1 Tax=Salinibacter ruber TaxID=146919 RepID=UPI001F079308|nr:hypothetical protein [Salinibacter ruber]
MPASWADSFSLFSTPSGRASWWVQPLWNDQSVQISEIRRVHVPTIESGLWLYTDPDGNPALTIGGGLEAPEELEERVTKSVPPAAKITGLGQEEEN